MNKDTVGLRSRIGSTPLHALSDEELRVKVAELCGWKNIRGGTFGKFYGDHENVYGRTEVPDYCRDLNAMHEAWNSLTPQQKVDFAYCLHYEILGKPAPDTQIQASTIFSSTINATARQRAEAFVRCLSPDDANPSASKRNQKI